MSKETSFCVELRQGVHLHEREKKFSKVMRKLSENGYTHKPQYDVLDIDEIQHIEFDCKDMSFVTWSIQPSNDDVKVGYRTFKRIMEVIHGV